jgi:hypothetical protein
MTSIGISEVLTRINDTVDQHTTAIKEYGIKFYTAKGALRDIVVRKYTRGALQETVGEDKRGKAAHNLQRNGLVMLQDLTNGRTIEVRATSIYGFRDFESDRWLKVFH